MDESRRKWLLVVLGAFCIGAAMRIAYVPYQIHLAQKKADKDATEAAAKAEELRAHPSSRVLELLNRSDASPPRLNGDFPCVFAAVTGSGVAPQLGNCTVPTQHSGPVDRFELDLRYGNFVLRQSDLYLSDVFDVPLTRSYNSRDYLHQNRVHAFGKNTNHPYDIALLGTRNPYTYNIVALEDGDYLFFARVSEGVGYADGVFQHTETSTNFYKAVTEWNGDGWTTWLTDGSSIRFPEAYGATNMAQGAPTQMRDAQGNMLKFLRDAQRNLLEIRTPHQHSIQFKYDEQSRITHAQDDQGTWADYRYNENGMLMDAILSSGHQRHYSYDGVLMTLIEDENKKVLLHNSFQGRVLIRQDFGNGRIYSYFYTPSTDDHYFGNVEVTQPDGTMTKVGTADSVPNSVKNPPH